MVEKDIRLKTHLGNGVYDTLHPETNSGIVRVGDKNLDETLGNVTAQLTQTANGVLERSKSRGADLVHDFKLDNTGQTDVSSLLQNILEEGKTYFFPKGRYLFTTRLNVPTNTKLIGDKAVIVRNGFVLRGSNIVVEGFNFEGHRVENTPADIAISIQEGGNNISIHSNTFDHTQIYGNDLEGTQGNLRITDNRFIGNYKLFSDTIRPITLIAYDGLIITGNFFECNTKGTSMIKMQGRFEDGTPNFMGEQYTKNTTITNNIFKGSSYSALSLYDGSGEIVISDNIFNLGTSVDPANRVIDGKNNGSYVLTDKIRNVVFSNNVVDGYYLVGCIRLQGAYGFLEEGSEQVGIISNNVMTNRLNKEISGYHIEMCGFHRGVIDGNVITHKSDTFRNDAIGIGGCRTINITNNSISQGSINVSNAMVTTSSDKFLGKIERVIVSNNTIEQYFVGGLYLRELNNPNVDVIMTGNLFHSDKGSPAQAHSVMLRLTPAIRTLIMTSNIGYNSLSVAGSSPDLNNSIITKLINTNNSWNV